MTTLTVYDSQGNTLDADGTEQANEMIKRFFFAGVKLYVEFGRETKLVAFFRARKSRGSRTEQYFTYYQTRDRTNVFKRFESALEDHLEREHGMSLETRNDDVIDFGSLDSKSYRRPGSEFDHKILNSLLTSGQKTTFGVSGLETALGLFQEYSQNPAQRIAIANKSNADELSECDLLIEIGNYSGVEPVGQTKQLFKREQSKYETQFVQQKVSTIRSEIADLRTTSSLSDAEIRDRLKRDLSIFESPSSGGLGPVDSDSPAGRALDKGKPILVGVGAALVMLIVLTLVANLAVVAGQGDLVPNQAEPLILLDADEETIEQIEINGEEVDEDPFETELDGEILINGSTGHNNISLAYVPDSSEEQNVSESIDVEDGNFSGKLSPVENDGNITITEENAMESGIPIEIGDSDTVRSLQLVASDAEAEEDETDAEAEEDETDAEAEEDETDAEDEEDETDAEDEEDGSGANDTSSEQRINDTEGV